jgi:hypothetical protein
LARRGASGTVRERRLRARGDGLRDNLWCGKTGAAELAQAAGGTTLVLSHRGLHVSQGGPLEMSIGDVRRIIGGEIVFAEELMSFAA